MVVLVLVVLVLVVLVLVVPLCAAVEPGLVPPAELEDSASRETVPLVNVVSCVLTAMMTAVLGCTKGASLLPALAATMTTVQPARPGVAMHAATDGSTAAHPASVELAMHALSVGAGGGGGGAASDAVWVTVPVIVPVASIAPPENRAMVGAVSVPAAVRVAPGAA